MRTPHAFLMCPPEYFDVSYIINPWMHGNVRKIDNALAKQQWRALYDILTDLATVRLVHPQPGSPDMVFTANAGLVLGRRFLVSRFRYPERQYEEPYFADWFMDRGYEVSLMPRDIPFEGAGDALLDRGTPRLWFAHGHRSVAAAGEVIAARLGCDVVSLRLTDQRFYHLDTCFCPLSAESVVYYPAAFDSYARQVIEANFPDRIELTEEEALDFVANAIVINKHCVQPKGGAKHLRPALESRGYHVHEFDMSEFLKAGGATKCLVLKLMETGKPAWSPAR